MKLWVSPNNVVTVDKAIVHDAADCRYHHQFGLVVRDLYRVSPSVVIDVSYFYVGIGRERDTGHKPNRQFPVCYGSASWQQNSTNLRRRNFTSGFFGSN